MENINAYIDIFNSLLVTLPQRKLSSCYQVFIAADKNPEYFE